MRVSTAWLFIWTAGVLAAQQDGARLFRIHCSLCHGTDGKMGDTTWAGVLTTDGDVLFSGGRDGYFFALDARTGELLWKLRLGGQVNSGPMSYAVNGRQYIAVAAGTSLFAFALRR